MLIVNNDYKEPCDLEDETLKKLDRIEKELIELINELENFKWFRSNELEVLRIRSYGSRLKKLYKIVGNRIDRLSL